MAKTKIGLRLTEKALGIVEKYQKDHPGTRTQAIENIILAYPLLQVKDQHRNLAKTIKENIPKEPIMPDLCIHIDDLDLNKDAIHCSKLKKWCKADACKGCLDRTTITDQ